jgi:hypothetical protein
VRGLSRELVDRRAVGLGALVALAVAVPTIVISSLVGVGSRSNAVFVPFLIYLAGQALGGWRAGRLRPDAPLSNGALASLAAYAAIGVVASVIRATHDRPLDPVSIVFNAFLAASAGILGGLLATWRRPAADGDQSRGR